MSPELTPCIRPPEGLNNKGSKSEIEKDLKTFAKDHQLEWSRKNTLVPENQKGGQVIEIDLGKGDSEYLVYIRGLVPEVLYVFRGEKLIGLHLNQVNYADLTVVRNQFVFSGEDPRATYLTEKMTKTGTTRLSAEIVHLRRQLP